MSSFLPNRVKAAVFALLGMALVFPCFVLAASPREMTIFSQPHRIDRVYLSMTGLVDNVPVSFVQGKKPELLWITGFNVEVVDPRTGAPLSPEYLCHSHLRFDFGEDLGRRDPKLGKWTADDYKLVTLVQGKTQVDLPEGFGIPILSNERFIFHSMVINNNPVAKPFDVKVKTTFHFYKEADLSGPLKPLVRRCITLRVPTMDQGHQMCLMTEGKDSEIDAESAEPVGSTPQNVTTKRNGQEVSYHWLVPPGRHTYRHDLGKLKIPYGTTIHYISAHLHPYGSYCELRDLTAGQTVFKCVAKNYPDRIGVRESGHYSSPEGLPVFKDHRYEIVSEYNNTTARDVDAMAVMYYYFLNKDYK